MYFERGYREFSFKSFSFNAALEISATVCQQYCPMNSWLTEKLLYCEGNKYDVTIVVHEPNGGPKCNKST